MNQITSYKNGCFLIGAGCNSGTVANTLSKLGYTGFEFMSIIPGTIGGLTYMNASAYHRSMSDILVVVNYLDNLGNFVAPSQDTEISLYVNILIDQSTVSTKEYKLTAHKPVVRNSTATIGSKDNPIYQGREEIDKIEIYFIEMGDQYGDSIYIKAGDFDMLIDAGQTSDGYNVLNFLKQHVADSRLDMVVTTHPADSTWVIVSAW